MGIGFIKVSVIIPVFNVEKYLGECLDSVLGQSLREIEVICVDDASTDASPNILSQYQSKDKRLTIISEAVNRGQAHARNRGMSVAKGKYIYFVDSDDVVKNNALKVLCDTAEKDGLDGVFFDAEISYEDGCEKYTYKARRDQSYPGIYNGLYLFKLHNETYDYDATVWRQFWKREFLQNNRLRFCEETSPHEDLLFSFQATLLAKRLKCIPDVLYLYRRRQGASTANEIGWERFSAMFSVYVEEVAFISRLREEIPKEEIRAIDKYLNGFQAYFRGYILKMRKKGEDISCMNLKKEFYRIFLHSVFLRQYLHVSSVLEDGAWRRIRKAETLIVYGAGKIGLEVMDQLHQYGIDSFLVAVTHRDEASPRYLQIYEIEELKEYAQEAIVLIAVGKRNQKDVLDYLKKLGFQDWVCMA